LRETQVNITNLENNGLARLVEYKERKVALDVRLLAFRKIVEKFYKF